MPSDSPDPDAFAVPSVAELERMRREYEFTMREFSRRAGFEDDRWRDILRKDIDPQLSTVEAFLDVLKDADPNGPRTSRGRPRNVEIRSDGGSR